MAKPLLNDALWELIEPVLPPMRRGVPLAAGVTGAHRHDVTQLLPLSDVYSSVGITSKALKSFVRNS